MEVKPDVIRMMRERPARQTWLTVADPGEVSTFDDIAKLAGLEPIGRAWVEVDDARAHSFLTGLLHRDLAYKSEVMPEHRAVWLAEQFLAASGKFGSRFATNSAELPHEFPFSWTPATEFTFDAGVAVIGEAGAGLFWVADED